MIIIRIISLMVGLMVMPSILHCQSLDSLLKLVVEKNRELKILHLEYEAILLQKDQVSQLPQPQLGVGVPVLRPETRLGPQVVMIGASQMFPWFGTLKAREEVVITMSKTRYERIAAQKLVLFHQLKKAYYQLQFIETKISIIKKITKQFEILEQVALSKVEAGMTNASNVLRVQLKLNELEEEIRVLENNKVPFFSIINELTEMPIGTKYKVNEINVPLPILEFDLDAFEVLISEHYPLINKIDLEIQSSKNRQRVNDKLGAPTFGIGMDYILVNERTDASPVNNGRDIFVPKVKLNIPIYRKKFKAKDLEEEKKQESLLIAKEDLVQKILNQLVTTKSMYDNGLIQLELYENQIDVVTMAMDILLAEYSSSGQGFDELLQVQNTLLGYQISIAKAKLDVQTSISDIERFTDF